MRSRRSELSTTRKKEPRWRSRPQKSTISLSHLLQTRECSSHLSHARADEAERGRILFKEGRLHSKPLVEVSL